MNIAATPAGHEPDPAFAFVQELAADLSRERIELPSFPDVAVRVRRALSEPEVSPVKIVRVVGSEPALAARLLQLANSAALSRGSKPLTDLKAAVMRIGFNSVRSTSIAFAISQMKHSAELKGMEKELNALWQRSTLVAALCHVIARHVGSVPADVAMLAGLLHSVGRLYVLIRSRRHPRLFSDPQAVRQIQAQWQANVGTAILENWEMPAEIVQAVQQQEDIHYDHDGPADLTDVLIMAVALANFREWPEQLAVNLQGVAAAGRISGHTNTLLRVIDESRAEVDALQAALGS